MKKNILIIFAVCLVLVMLFCFVSCNGGNENNKKDSSETIGTTDNTEKEKTEGELVTVKDNQGPKVTDITENEKQTGSITSETSKPSDEQQSDTRSDGRTSMTETGEKDTEGESVIHSKEIQLPIISIP